MIPVGTDLITERKAICVRRAGGQGALRNEVATLIIEVGSVQQDAIKVLEIHVSDNWDGAVWSHRRTTEVLRRMVGSVLSQISHCR